MLHICNKCGYAGEDGPLHNVPGVEVRECQYFAAAIGREPPPLSGWAWLLCWLACMAVVLGLAWVAAVYGPGPGAAVPAVGVVGDCAAPGVPTPVYAGSAVVGVACI